MFEAYGWLKLSGISDLRSVEVRLVELEGSGVFKFQIQPDLNWAGSVLTLMTCRNHRSDRLLKTLRWIASQSADCYGVVHFRDQEASQPNEFRVWRIARGEVSEFADPFLSPCVPTVESEYDPSRNL